MRTPLIRFSTLGLGAMALALVFAAPSARSADDDTASPPQLSDTVGDALSKLKPLLDAKDWAAAVTLVDNLLQGVKAESYDQAFLLETKAKIYTQNNDYADSLEPLATAVAIGDRHHYYSPHQEMDLLYYLSQLYYQQAEGTKTDKDAQVAAYQKSVDAIRRWFQLNTKPNEDVSEYYARLLYSEAVARDPMHPDQDLIKQAREEVQKTLLTSVHPKDGTYTFLLATFQQEQNYPKAAAVLELMLAKNPSNKGYWQDLVTFYIVLAQNEKDPEKLKTYNLRAINALERAQALGYMHTPKDNYLLFTFYYEMGQFSTAADILHKGLENGTIDSDMDKWDLLASSYEQVNQEFTAIEILKEAAKHFPDNGEIDLKIGGIYSGLDKGEEAFEYYKTAMDKGNVPKSQRPYLYLALAYQAYELQKFDEAENAINKALELNSGKSDKQLHGLKNAIDEAIKERDAKKAADAAAATS